MLLIYIKIIWKIIFEKIANKSKVSSLFVYPHSFIIHIQNIV